MRGGFGMPLLAIGAVLLLAGAGGYFFMTWPEEVTLDELKEAQKSISNFHFEGSVNATEQFANKVVYRSGFSGDVVRWPDVMMVEADTRTDFVESGRTEIDEFRGRVVLKDGQTSVVDLDGREKSMKGPSPRDVEFKWLATVYGERLEYEAKDQFGRRYAVIPGSVPISEVSEAFEEMYLIGYMLGTDKPGGTMEGRIWVDEDGRVVRETFSGKILTDSFSFDIRYSNYGGVERDIRHP